MNDWPKDIVIWEDSEHSCMSIPFTWLLPRAKLYIESFPGSWLVGGPAVSLMPKYLSSVATIGNNYAGVLHRINPEATRTTYGCPRGCPFCGVKTICGPFRVLNDWKPKPIVCDDNILAAGETHFAFVCAKLAALGWCDFNQGLDARLLTRFHADCIAEIKRPIVRLALDDDKTRDAWANAFEHLRSAGIAKRNIRSLVLCGFSGSCEEDWWRCEFVESFGVKASPMWFHNLNCLHYGEVTAKQESMGWSKEKQRQIMRWYYKHSGKKMVA